MSLADIQALPPGEWQIHPAAYPTFPYSSAAYWFQIDVRNPANAIVPVLLVIDNEFLNTIRLFALHGERLLFERTSGWDLPFYEREIPNPKFAFRLELPDRSRTRLFLRITSRHAWNLPLMLMDERAYLEWASNEQLRMGFYFTSLLVLILVNVVFLRIFREPYQPMYLVYLLFNFAFQFSLHGYLFKYLTPDWPWIIAPLNLIFAVAMTVTGMAFARAFLRTELHMPGSHRFVGVLMLIGLTLPVWMLVCELGFLEEIMGMTYFPACIAMTIYMGVNLFLGKGFRPAFYYTLAWGFYMLGSAVFFMQRGGLLAGSPIDLNMHEYLAIGSVGEALLFTLGIASRIQLLLDEQGSRDSEVRPAPPVLSEAPGAANPATPAPKPAEAREPAAAVAAVARGADARPRRISRLSRLDLRQVVENLQQAMEIRQVYRRQLTLADLAREVAISEKDLSEFLNEHLRKSFYSYINEFRVADARRLLENRPELKIIEICSEVGFQSLSSFNNAFNRHTGQSPREYRRMLSSRE